MEILNHPGDGEWHYPKNFKVWDSLTYEYSFCPTAKVRTNVINAGNVIFPETENAILRLEFNFRKDTDLWYPFQLETFEIIDGKAKFYNVEAHKEINVSTTGIKDLWDVKCQGNYMRVGLKAGVSCTVGFEVWLAADI